MTKITVIEDFEEIEAIPEYVLWLAVIDRAIADYCCPAQDLTQAYSGGLHSFFFDEEPRPNNLIYICNFLLDRDDAVVKIRDRVTQIKNNSSVNYSYMRYYNSRR
jgi:hypothetical protein